MAETKTKTPESLRTPKPKKKLGLTVPPVLRLPHDDLISPAQPEKKDAGSLPSQASQTRQGEQPSVPSQTRQARQTSHTTAHDETSLPVAPQRDYTKVANSIGREAVPSGLFTGKSKQLYDCLYSLTRGAVVPSRAVRISRPKLMKKAGIGSRVTFDANIERLIRVGLIGVRPIAGEHEGNEYTVLLPEEVEASMPSQASQTGQTSLTSPAQKLDSLVCLETSQTRHSLSPRVSTIYDNPKTLFKTIEKNFDDEAFAGLIELLRETVKELTGKSPSGSERERWRELGELLMAELRIAAARTTVSSVPSFFTEHLRRRLWKMDKKPVVTDEKNASEVTETAPQPIDVKNCADCGGTGFYYPQGYEGGVARCRHEKAGAPPQGQENTSLQKDSGVE